MKVNVRTSAGGLYEIENADFIDLNADGFVLVEHSGSSQFFPRESVEFISCISEAMDEEDD